MSQKTPEYLAQLAQEGRHTELLQIFQEMLQTAPDDPTLLYNAGLSAYLLGQFAESIDYLKRLKALAPQDLKVRAKLVQAYEALERFGERDAKRGELVALVGQQPPSPDRPTHYCRDQFTVAGGSLHLPHPRLRALQLTLLQGPLRPFHQEALRRHAQVAPLLDELLGDGSGGVAEELDEERVDRRIGILNGDPGVEGRDLDARQAVGRQTLEEFLGVRRRAEGTGRRADDERIQARQLIRLYFPHLHDRGAERVAQRPGHLLRVAEDRIVND